MHIVYLHQYFVTNTGSSGTRSYDMARQLVRRGHKVSLITGMLDHSELRCDRSLWQKHEVDGIDVYVLNIDYGSGGRPVRRVACWLMYATLASMLMLRLRKPDVVYASSTPPTVALPALVGRLFRRVPFVYELRDLWPESLIWVGLRDGSVAVRAMRVFNRLTFRFAERITTITPGFVGPLHDVYGVPEDQVDVIPIGADSELFPMLDQGDPSGPTFREGPIGPDDMVAVYAGAFGRANHLGYLLDAADALRDRSDIKFILVGQGKEKAQLVERIEKDGLHNVIVRDPLPKTELARLLPSADIGINCVMDGDQNRVAFPNKAFDYLFAGLAVLTTAPTHGGGCLQELVEAERCGAGVDACNPNAAVTLLRAWADDRVGLREMGERARTVALGNYDRDQLAGDLEDLLREVVAIGGEAT